MIVPFAAGGGSDLMARKMAQGISDVRKGVDFSIDYRPGGNGVLGYSYLKSHRGDPQALLASETAAIALPILLKPAPFHWTDFTPIAQIAGDSQLLVVSAKSSYHSLGDLIAAAKKKTLKVGLTSTTSSDAIVTRLFEQNQGLKFRSVVLESGSNSTARLLNGDIDFTILNPSETIGLMQANRVRPLAAFSDERYPKSSALKDVPTAREQGVDVSFAQYRGLFAPGGITQAQRDYWANALRDWTKTASYNDYISKNNLFPEFRQGKAFEAYLKQTQATLDKVLKKD